MLASLTQLRRDRMTLGMILLFWPMISWAIDKMRPPKPAAQ